MTDSPTLSLGQVTDLAVKAAIDAACGTPSDPTAYRALSDRKARARVRDGVTARRNAAVMTLGTIEDVRAEYARLDTVLESLKSTGSASVPTDPKVALANYAATLRLAADLVDTFGHDSTDVTTRTGTPNVAAAMKLSEKSVSTGTRATPGSTDYSPEGIVSAVTSADGPLTVPEILRANKWPSKFNGRVRAWLESPARSASDGVTVTRDENNVLTVSAI